MHASQALAWINLLKAMHTVLHCFKLLRVQQLHAVEQLMYWMPQYGVYKAYVNHFTVSVVHLPALTLVVRALPPSLSCSALYWPREAAATAGSAIAGCVCLVMCSRSPDHHHMPLKDMKAEAAKAFCVLEATAFKASRRTDLPVGLAVTSHGVERLACQPVRCQALHRLADQLYVSVGLSNEFESGAQYSRQGLL